MSATRMITVQTARLILRPFALDDLDALATICSDSEVMRFIGDGKPQSKDQTAVRLAAILEHYDRHRFGLWAVVERRAGDLIGFCGLQFLDNTAEVEVGYRLATRFWGKGLASEGAAASLQYGFGQLGLDRIVAVVHPANIASQRVIEKIGLKYEKNARYYGTDVKYYAIAREAYEPTGSFYLCRSEST